MLMVKILKMACMCYILTSIFSNNFVCLELKKVFNQVEVNNIKKILTLI